MGKHDDAVDTGRIRENPAASCRLDNLWLIPNSFTTANDLRDGAASSPPYVFETTYFTVVFLLICASNLSTYQRSVAAM